MTSFKRVRQFAAAAMVAGVVAMISGCASIQGHWVGGDMRPEMARDQYDLFRQKDDTSNLVSVDIRFQADKTFLADLKYGDRVQRTSGTYRLEGERLTLTDDKGVARIFVLKRPDAQTIQMITGIKGTDVTLTLKAQQQK